MNKYKYIFITLIVLVLGFIFWSYNNVPENNNANSNQDIVGEATLFYGVTCPHCKDLDAWIKKNKIDDKIKITKKEIYNNKNNSKELGNIAASCGFNINQVGVPFLYMDGKCYMGGPDAQEALNNKTTSQSGAGDSQMTQ